MGRHRVVLVAVLVLPAVRSLLYDDATGAAHSIPTYSYRLGNDSFAVRGPAWFADGAMVDATASGHIVFVQVETATINVEKWASACSDVACAGVVFYAAPASNLQSMLEITAWTYRTERTSPFASVPCAAMRAAAIDNLAPGTIVTLTANERPNPAGDVIQSTAIRALFATIVVIRGITIVGIVLRLVAFLFGASGAVRPVPVFALLTLIFMMAMATATLTLGINIAFLDAKALPYSTMLWAMFGDAPFGYMTRVTTGFVLRATAAKDAPAPSRPARIFMLSYTLTMAGIATSYLGVALYAVATQTFPFGITALAVALAFPNFVFWCMNVKASSKISKVLLTGGANLGLSAEATKFALVFAWKTAICTLFGFGMLVGQVVFVFVQGLSPASFMTAYGTWLFFSALHQWMFLAFIRPATKSILSRFGWTSSKRTLPNRVPANPATRPWTPSKQNRDGLPLRPNVASNTSKV